MVPRDEPRQIGRYEIRRELGRGMMGVVYEAWDPMLGRSVALKTVRALAPASTEREAWEQRFLNEARAAARLSHPAIVVVHDVGRDGESGLLYMALEHLKGDTLAEKIAAGQPLPWRESLRIVGRIADALHHAHAQGVVHRDVKPANVIVLPSGEPKILDFGIARLDTGHLTLPGDLFGTPLYMSPEQAAGRALDARSDLFSLGAIAWAMLTGRTPFDGPSVGAILARVVHRHPKPPSELVPGIPADVDYVVARAMAKSPDDRYADGRLLCEDVEDVLAGRTPRHRADWTPPSPGDRTIGSPGARPDDDLPDLDLLDEPLAKPEARGRPRRHGAPRAALFLVLVLTATAYFVIRPADGQMLVTLVRQSPAARSVADLLPAFLAVAPKPTAPSAAPAAAAPEAGIASSPAVSSAAGDAPGSSSAASVAAGSNPTADDASRSAKVDLEAEAQTPPAKTGTQAAPTAPPPQEGSTSPVSQPRSDGQRLLAPATGPTPTPAPRKKAAPPGKAHPTAFLSIGFEHRLRSGSLEVWVDGVAVATEKLDSRVTKKLLGFEERKGSVQQTLSLKPGRHQVKVRVRSGGETKTASTATTFHSGATRRLEAKISRLSGKLTLDWE